jgi:hypothetical protein
VLASSSDAGIAAVTVWGAGVPRFGEDRGSLVDALDGLGQAATGRA